MRARHVQIALIAVAFLGLGVAVAEPVFRPDGGWQSEHWLLKTSGGGAP